MPDVSLAAMDASDRSLNIVEGLWEIRTETNASTPATCTQHRQRHMEQQRTAQHSTWPQPYEQLLMEGLEDIDNISCNFFSFHFSTNQCFPFIFGYWLLLLTATKPKPHPTLSTTPRPSCIPPSKHNSNTCGCKSATTSTKQRVDRAWGHC